MYVSDFCSFVPFSHRRLSHTHSLYRVDTNTQNYCISLFNLSTTYWVKQPLTACDFIYKTPVEFFPRQYLSMSSRDCRLILLTPFDSTHPHHGGDGGVSRIKRQKKWCLHVAAQIQHTIAHTHSLFSGLCAWYFAKRPWSWALFLIAIPCLAWSMVG